MSAPSRKLKCTIVITCHASLHPSVVDFSHVQYQLSSETTERNLTKLEWKQLLKVFHQVNVFSMLNLKQRRLWPLIGWDIFDFSATADQNFTNLEGNKYWTSSLYRLLLRNQWTEFDKTRVEASTDSKFSTKFVLSDWLKNKLLIRLLAPMIHPWKESFLSTVKTIQVSMQYLKLYKTVMSYFYLMLNYQLNILEKISDTLHGKGQSRQR